VTLRKGLFYLILLFPAAKPKNGWSGKRSMEVRFSIRSSGVNSLSWGMGRGVQLNGRRQVIHCSRTIWKDPFTDWAVLDQAVPTTPITKPSGRAQGLKKFPIKDQKQNCK
jgi:hypothetical protein